MGTPAYIAPEQAQGRPLTPATDVYAAGTVLYEMLAGRLPYDAADSPLVALFQHVHEDHRPLLEVAPETPPPVAEVVERSLARDPNDRFESAAAMGSELVGAAESSWGPVWESELNRVLRSPITGGPPTPASGAATQVPRSRPVELTTGERTAATPVPPTGEAEAAASSARVGGARRRRLALAAIVAAVVLLIGGDDGSPDAAQLAGLPAIPAAWPSNLVLGADLTSRPNPGQSGPGRDLGRLRAGVFGGDRLAELRRGRAVGRGHRLGRCESGRDPDLHLLLDRPGGTGPRRARRGLGAARRLGRPPDDGALLAGCPRPAPAGRRRRRRPARGDRGRADGVAEPGGGDDRAADQVPAVVGASGVPELAGLPDTLAGFAQAWVVLRDRVAPDVMLAYPTADWGNGSKVVLEDLPTRKAQASAKRNAEFYDSLGAKFDFATLEVASYDAGYLEVERNDRGRGTWTPDDYARHWAWVETWVEESGLRVVLTQVPFGNTQMAAVDDTPFHYQDNHVETLLGEEGFTTLTAYRDAGVIGVIFGTGRGRLTCPCDAAGDGVTDPPPAAGNAGRESLSADDDGGCWRQRSAPLRGRRRPRALALGARAPCRGRGD